MRTVTSPDYKIYPWTKEEDELITKLKKEGKNTKEIATKVKNHSYNGVRERLRKLGLSGPARLSWTEDEIQQLHVLRLSGASWTKIAQKLGRSPGTCQNKYSDIWGEKKKKEELVPQNIYKNFKKGEIFKTEEGRRLKFLRTIETKNRMHVFQHPAGWIETFTDAQLI
jgi:IS30 family transposase